MAIEPEKVKNNKPLDWLATLNLSEAVKDLIIKTYRDKEGLHGILDLATLIDPATGKAFSSNNALPVTGTLNAGIDVLGFNPVISTETLMYYYDSSKVNYAGLVRTPNVWKNLLVSANGSTPIWTSAAGKKARLMGWRATIVSGTTAAASCLLKILDVAADTGIGVQICGAALGAVPNSTIIANETFMNGYLMAATNTAINVNLSSVLGVAGVHVQVWGTEE